MSFPEVGRPVAAGRDSAGDPAQDPAEAAVEALGFEVFYRAHFSRLVAFLLFQGASEMDAADVAQETMIKLFARWAVVDAPSAWVNVVASRELIRRRVEDRPSVLVGEVAESTVIPEGVETRWYEQHEVLRLLRLLPARQCQVLSWTFDGYTPDEIAGYLGVPSSTVRANLYKARRALSRHFGLGKGQR